MADDEQEPSNQSDSESENVKLNFLRESLFTFIESSDKPAENGKKHSSRDSGNEDLDYNNSGRESDSTESDDVDSGELTVKCFEEQNLMFMCFQTNRKNLQQKVESLK
jgi:hypothetical protein